MIRIDEETQDAIQLGQLIISKQLGACKINWESFVVDNSVTLEVDIYLFKAYDLGFGNITWSVYEKGSNKLLAERTSLDSILSII